MEYVWAIAILIVSLVITALITPGPKKAADAIANQLKDFQFPIPDEGAAQSVTFGDCWTSDWQVLWFGNFRKTDIKGPGQSGKK